MGTTIYRGSTPVIKFKPLNDVSVADLGTPSIAIAQELVYLTPEVTVDTDDNSISAKLTEDDTLSLVEGVETSAQQIWQQENGNIIRYPVHQLTVAETIMEEVDSEQESETIDEPENLHPFMVYSPFAENGYFEEYTSDATEKWNLATTPWNEYLDDYIFRYDASANPELSDFTMIPLCVSSLFTGQEYYLWVNAVGPNSITIDFIVGTGYSFDTVNGAATYSITLSNSDALVRLVAGDASFSQPMLQIRVRTPNATSENGIGMALYAVQENLAESEYTRYISYEEGGV